VLLNFSAANSLNIATVKNVQKQRVARASRKHSG